MPDPLRSENTDAHRLHDPGGKVHIRLPDGMRGSASFSSCGKYRNTLIRDWTLDGQVPRKILFVGMNPSVARAEVSDPTCDKEVKYARRWGFSRYVKVNMVDWRATNPKDLPPDPGIARSVENLPAILEEALTAEEVLLAYGKMHKRYAGIIAETLAALRAIGTPLSCLKINKGGSPAHPLYIPNAAERFPFPNE